MELTLNTGLWGKSLAEVTLGEVALIFVILAAVYLVLNRGSRW